MIDFNAPVRSSRKNKANVHFKASQEQKSTILNSEKITKHAMVK